MDYLKQQLLREAEASLAKEIEEKRKERNRRKAERRKAKDKSK